MIIHGGGRKQYAREIAYLKKTGFKGAFLFPYDFVNEYKNEIDWVGSDEKGSYTMTMDEKNPKKLYWSFDNKKEIARKYRSLRVEQDINSPHRYFVEGYYPSENDIMIDVGSAEGKEALAVVDTVKKMYLFECEENWKQALRNTFGDYGDKVTIHSCYAGNEDDDRKNVHKLDTIFADLKGESIFLKMDVEGMEKEVLLGARNLIMNNDVRVLCCTYHRHDDAAELAALFDEWGFEWEFSDNYMLFIYDRKIQRRPYFRHGVIRGTRKMGGTI